MLVGGGSFWSRGKNDAEKILLPGQAEAQHAAPLMFLPAHTTEWNCKKLRDNRGNLRLTGKKWVGRVGEEKAKLLHPARIRLSL